MIQWRPKPNESIKLNGDDGRLQTGDIVLFAGKGWFSWIIKFGTYGPRPHIPRWSHVGVIVRLKPADLLAEMRALGKTVREPSENCMDFDSDLFIVESTTLSNVNDVILRKAIKGVQIVRFHDRLQAYQGTAAVRSVYAPRTEEMRAKALKYIAQNLGKPYEKRNYELILSGTRWLKRFIKGNRNTLFCSEFAIGLMQTLGWLRPKKGYNDPSHWAPSHMGKYMPINPDIDIGQPRPYIP